MKASLIIQYSGWHENGATSEKKFTIVTIEDELTMDKVNKELEKDGLLSPYRRKKDIIIHSMQSVNFY